MCTPCRVPSCSRTGDKHQLDQENQCCERMIVLKEIIIIFIVLRDHVWHFRMVHRFVREMDLVYCLTKFG